MFLQYHISVLTFVYCTIKYIFLHDMICSLRAPLILNKTIVANSQRHYLYSTTSAHLQFVIITFAAAERAKVL